MGEEPRKFISFEEFELDTGHRRLLREGKPVTIYAKTFDLLSFLVQNSGRILTKDEILDEVWAGQFVEEANLSVQISALRKALGETAGTPRFLVTVPGKGYKFVADLNHRGSEIVIEKQRFARLVVEEEIDDQIETSGDPGDSIVPMEKDLTDLTPVTGKGSRPGFTRKIVLLSAVLTGLLLVTGFGGYLLLRSDETKTGILKHSADMTMIRITDGKIRGCPSISPDGKFVAFIENGMDGTGTLYLHQTDTNTTLQLLQPGDRNFGCTNFSSDGSLVYYVVIDRANPDAALFSIPVLGGTPRKVLNNLGYCFTLSPDGKRVAFFRKDKVNNQEHLLIASLDGSDEKKLLTRNFSEIVFKLGLAWSPDGKTIAFAANPEPANLYPYVTIFNVNINDSKITPLTAERYANIAKMSWTSDGLNLGFVGARSRESNKLYLMDGSSGRARKLTNDLEKYRNYGMSFTRDSSTLVANVADSKTQISVIGEDGDTDQATRFESGRDNGVHGITGLSGDRIAYIKRTSSGLEIKTAKDDGSEEKILTSDNFFQTDLTSTPDGRYLIYSSDQAGERHIFRMDAKDGSNVEQITFGKSFNSRPDISPNGKWIIYSSSIGDRSKVWRIPLNGGKPTQLTNYECYSPVFDPDGETFACVLSVNSLADLANIAIVPKDGGSPIKKFQVLPFRWTFKIRWSPDGKSIVFFKSEEGAFNLWEQPISGEAPRKLTNYTSGEIFNFAYSSDGKKIYLAQGVESVDVVLIKNFIP